MIDYKRGFSHPSRDPETWDEMRQSYDIIMEMLVATNELFPQMEIWLKDNEYINRVVKRVIYLRTDGYPDAKPRIIRSKLSEVDDVLRFVCVVAFDDGRYEDPDGELVVL